MRRTGSRRTDRGTSRKRLVITFLASALLLALMLAPALRHRSSEDTADEPYVDDAADVADESPAASDVPADSTARDIAAVAVAGHAPERTSGSITMAHLPYTQGSGTLDDASVQEWIALQPFRVPSDQQGARELTARAFDAGSNGLGAFLSPAFSGLRSRASAASSGDLGSGGGTSQGAGSASSGARSGSTGQNSDTGTGQNGGGGNGQASGSSNNPVVGTEGHGSNQFGGANGDGSGDGHPGAPGNTNGNSQGDDDHDHNNAGGGNGGVQFVPDNHDSGDPHDMGTSPVLTDSISNPGDGPHTDWSPKHDDDPLTPSTVPEPTSLLMLGTGLVFAARTLRYRRLRTAVATSSSRPISS